MKSVVLTMDRSTRLDMRNKPPGPSLLLNDDVGVLFLPDDAETPLAKKLASQNLLKTGAMLVQSPFDPSIYARAEEANEVFTRTKHFLFVDFCRLLGATRVKVGQIDVHTSKTKYTIRSGGKISGWWPRLGSGADREKYMEFSREFFVEGRFEGSPPDIRAAQKLLNRNGLANDQQMVSLLSAVQGSNPIHSLESQIKASSECMTKLRIASSLEIPSFAGISAEIQKKVKNTFECSVKYDVVFERRP